MKLFYSLLTNSLPTDNIRVLTRNLQNAGEQNNTYKYVIVAIDAKLLTSSADRLALDNVV